MQHPSEVCPKIQSKLKTIIVESGGWIPVWSGGAMFQIVGPSPANDEFVVDLE